MLPSWIESMTFDQWGSLATLLATFVVAFATYALVRITRTLASETRRMADESARPHIVATIEPSQWSLIHSDLVIQNTGKATAYDVRVGFAPELRRHSEHAGAKDEPMPFESISVLKPDTKFSSFIGTTKPFFEIDYEVCISWKRDARSSEREENIYTFSMKAMKGMTRLGAATPLTQIAEEIKHIREDWRWVASGSHRTKVDAYTSSDRMHKERTMSRRRRSELREQQARADENRRQEQKVVHSDDTSE